MERYESWLDSKQFLSSGATPRSNNFTLDGAIIQNGMGLNPASTSGSTLGVDGIKEFKVITNLFSAEYGLTMGSQTTIVSRGGTNQFHGDVFESLRNAAFDAKNPFNLTRPGFKRNQFGGTFGGRIKKDKTFSYGVFEALQENLGLTPPLQSGIPEEGCRGAWNPGGAANAVIWNGLGSRPAGYTGNGTPAQVCPQLGVAVPTSVSINPAIVQLLDPAILPLPNVNVGVAGPGGDSFVYGPKQVTMKRDKSISPSPFSFCSLLGTFWHKSHDTYMTL